MREAWIIADSIVSPFGFSSAENYLAVRNGNSAVKKIQSGNLHVYASQISGLSPGKQYTRFEAMCAAALDRVMDGLSLPPARTLFILSTTKGNIALLEQGHSDDRIHLHRSAALLAQSFGFQHHMVVSNACISGVMAVIVARRYMASGKYDHAVVLGADELSEFITSGFQSLSALSDEPCRPFDAARKGVNLGECAAALVMTTNPESLGRVSAVKVSGGGLSNDANHISGPSRTGDELANAVRQAMTGAGTSASDLGFISAHGTATVYNDEMEAKAFYGAGLAEIPLNSLKGAFGHTLGAAGVLETILSLHSLRANEVLPTVNFESLGVSQPVTINKTLLPKNISACLKTASGFGGCNAAIVLQKVNP